MTKGILFLEANTTGTASEAMQVAKERGYTTYFATADRLCYSALPDNPLDLADVVLDCDTYSPAAVLGALRPVAVDAVVAFDDYHLLSAAECGSVLGLPHAEVAGLVSARYKHLTRECTRGLPGAVRAMAFNEEEFDRVDLAGLAYPLVVKPIDESGSVAVRLCRDQRDVEGALADFRRHQVNRRGYRPRRALLFEEYVEGEEYSCELYWDKNAAGWRVAGVTKKVLGPPPYFVEIGHVFPAVLPDATRQKVERRVLSWLAALGLRCGAAHVEFRLEEDEPYLIEVNPRLAGGHITELVRWSTGIDLIAHYLDFHLLDPPITLAQPPPFGAAAVRFFLLSEVANAQDAQRLGAFFADLPTFQRGKIALSEEPGESVARSNYDRRGYALLAGRSHQSVVQDLAALDARVNGSNRLSVQAGVG